jgi:hypothetical protein
VYRALSNIQQLAQLAPVATGTFAASASASASAAQATHLKSAHAIDIYLEGWQRIFSMNLTDLSENHGCCCDQYGLLVVWAS